MASAKRVAAAAPAVHRPQHGKGSNGELSSYSDILSFTPSQEVTVGDSHKKSIGGSSKRKDGGELSSYSNILSFGSGHSLSRGRHQKRASKGKGFEDEWNSLWTTATATKVAAPSPAHAHTPPTAARGNPAASKAEQKEKVEKELREVDKAIAKETHAPAAAQQAGAPHLKRDVKVSCTHRGAF